MSPNYVELINRGGRTAPDRTAILFEGASLSFAETHRVTNQLANVFADKGLKRGDRLGLLVNNSLYSVPLDFACAKAGLNRVPLNGRLSVSEHARMLQDTDCKTLVFGPDLEGQAKALKETVPGLVCFPLGEPGAGLLGEAAQASDAGPDVAVADDDVVLTDRVEEGPRQSAEELKVGARSIAGPQPGEGHAHYDEFKRDAVGTSGHFSRSRIATGARLP